MKEQKENLLITVIIPAYNVEKYIERCVLSVINQAYKNLQIILVDDCSTDKTTEICQQLAKKDNRIELIQHKENRGLTSVRREGVGLAKGDYIGFVDGDDYIHESMYEDMLKVGLEAEADIVQTGNLHMLNNGKTIEWNPKRTVYNISKKKDEFINQYILDKKYENRVVNGSLCNKIIKSSILKTGYNDVPKYLMCSDDIVAVLSAIIHSKSVQCTGKIGYYRVIRSDSITYTNDMETIINRYASYQAQCEIMKKYGVYEAVKDNLKSTMYREFLPKIGSMLLDDYSLHVHIYPKIKNLLDKKILIYGAGNVGRDYYAQICKYERCQIAGWVDRNFEKYNYSYAEVVGVDKIKDKDYDVLLIAVADSNIADEIKEELLSLGVSEEKIVWDSPENIFGGNAIKC